MQSHQPGRVLGGKYRLIRQFGQGGMGSLWSAEHLTLSSQVALKLIDPAVASNPEAVQRFLREARTAAALRSPHVVQILDYGVDGETPYIAMEMLDGESLADRLDQSGSLSVLETARVIRHVARAIGRAHDAGVVHRDLKPENVFIVRNDDEEVIKVLDFGIVKVHGTGLDASAPPSATRTGALLGTPYYMSPEQAEGVARVDFRADLWALGVIAYQCVLGQLPFRGDSVGSLILQICSHPLPVPSAAGPVPRGFDAWFARACARDPRARFDSAKQAADAFDHLDEAALAGPSSHEVIIDPALAARSAPPPPTTTTQPSTSELAAAPPRHHLPSRLAIAVLAAVVALGGSVWLGRGGLAQRPPTATQAGSVEGAAHGEPTTAAQQQQLPREPTPTPPATEPAPARLPLLVTGPGLPVAHADQPAQSVATGPSENALQRARQTPEPKAAPSPRSASARRSRRVPPSQKRPSKAAPVTAVPEPRPAAVPPVVDLGI